MAEFRRDFRSAPVPIRLSCPFSNGITLNYYARAVSCNSRVLKVISVNPFERELQLFVAAPFISGVSRCLVASVARSKRQASTFEIDLRFVESPVLVGATDERLPRRIASQLLSADIAAVAAEMAASLESTTGLRFAEAFAEVKNQDRHLKLLALIAALLRITRARGLASTAFIRSAVSRHRPGQVGQIRTSSDHTAHGKASQRRAE